MPVYEYVCNNCGLKFEMIRPMRDADAPIKCESCFSKETKRALSICFSHSEGNQASSSSSHSCTNCNGGSCSNCH
jgi:putative FmdB family regulatory protein